MGKRCVKCGASSSRNGLSASGVQRYRCARCGATFQKSYKQACRSMAYRRQVVRLLCSGVSARGIGRLLGTSAPTVLRTIGQVAAGVSRPVSPAPGLDYEIDEMRVVVGKKQRPYYLTYALCRQSGQVVSFTVGYRNKRNLGSVVRRVLSLAPRHIYTDRYNLYVALVPHYLHRTQRRCINHIERHNLTLRQHLQCLSRRTLGFGKSLAYVAACLRLYWWGGSCARA